MPRASASERAWPSDSTSGHRSKRTWDVWLPPSSFSGSALSEEKGFEQRNEIKEICYKNNATRDKKAVERTLVEHYRHLLERLAPIDESFEFEFLSLMPRLEQNVCGYVYLDATAAHRIQLANRIHFNHYVYMDSD